MAGCGSGCYIWCTVSAQSAILWGLIYVSNLVRLAALVRIVANRMVSSHFFFFGMLCLSLARNVAFVFVSTAQVRTFFAGTAWPMTGLEIGAVVEAFWGVAKHFRRIRGFGWVLIAVILGTSGLASAAIGVLRANWEFALAGPILLGMYANVALLFAALLSFFFFRQFPSVPIRPNAVRHLLLLSLFLGAYSIAHLIGGISGVKYVFVPQLMLNLGPIVAFTWWTMIVNREGERLPFAPPSELTAEQFEASERHYREQQETLRQAGEEALRKSAQQ